MSMVRRILWVLLFVVTTSAEEFLLNVDVEELESCSWCEAGACTLSPSVTVVKAGFPVSISAQVGRSYPYWRPAGQVALGEGSDATAAFLVHHGAARNGDEYTLYAANAVDEDVLVIGAQIYEAGDPGLEDSDIWWAPNNDDGFDDDTAASDWHWGGQSTNELPATISSFKVMDEIVGTLLNRTLYPNLENLIIGGHSAGGQIVQRYALLTNLPVDDRIKYFAANPSSLAWLTSERPVLTEESTCCKNETILTQSFTFADSIDDDCQHYDTYGYGLNGLPTKYSMATPLETSLQRYARRQVYYVSGSADVCDTNQPKCAGVNCLQDDGGLDTSCEAEAQGPCRLYRMHAFYQHLERYYGRRVHTLIAVPNVGHSGCGVLQSKEFLTAAFPPYEWSCTPKWASFCQPTRWRDSKETRPGTILMGGSTDVDAAFAWHIARAGGGNFLVLRESGTDAYNNYILAVAHECSRIEAVATLILKTKEAGSDDMVLTKVGLADAIFFAGGDQSKYVDRIQGSPLESLLKLQGKAISIGGTSAGNAIQGHDIYTGLDALGPAATSDACLANPYTPSLGPGALVSAILAQQPILDADVIMDDHFVARDRMGRLITFLARLFIENGGSPRGIGVDERTALLVDSNGRVAIVGDGTAYFCEILGDVTCEADVPLTATNVQCTRLQAKDFSGCDDDRPTAFDLPTWSPTTGDATTYTFDVVSGVIIGDPYGPAIY